MSTQNLIIYKFASLYHILQELGLDLNFKISFVDNENSLNEKVKNSNAGTEFPIQRYSPLLKNKKKNGQMGMVKKNLPRLTGAIGTSSI